MDIEVQVFADLVVQVECARCFKIIRKEERLNEYNLTTGNYTGTARYFTEALKRNVYNEATRRGWGIAKLPHKPDEEEVVVTVCGVCLAKEKDQP